MTSEIERALRHPFTWVSGAIVSVFGVLSAVAIDPVTAASAIVEVFVAMSSTIFTASSIAGFTLGPMVGPFIANAFKVVALISGSIVVISVLSNVWDRIEKKLE